MRCPQCGEGETAIVEVRALHEGREVRRRRSCEACGERFTTYERSEAVRLRVVKRDGTIRRFDAAMLFAGVDRAEDLKRIPREALDRLADEVEAEIAERGRELVTSREIGDLVLVKLKALDRVAYQRFASAYRHFDEGAGAAREQADADPEGDAAAAGGDR